MKRKSTIILLIGFMILLVGAVMSVLDIEPYANYVLIAGAIVVVIRGFVRTHERDEMPSEHNPEETEND